MATLTAGNLHIPADDQGRAGAFAALDAKRAGWDTMNFAAVRLGQGKTFEIAIDAFEYVAVVLSGRCNIRSNKGDFRRRWAGAKMCSAACPTPSTCRRGPSLKLSR